MAWFQGESFKGLEMGEQSVVIFRSLEDIHNLADALYVTALAATSSQDSSRTILLLEESITLYEQMNEPGKLADSMWLYGSKLHQRGEQELGLSLLEQSRQLAVKHNRLPLLAVIEKAYGWIAFDSNDLASALSHCKKCDQILKKLGIKNSLSGPDTAYGDILVRQAKFDQARTYYQKSLDMDLERGNTANAAKVIERLGNLALHEGQISKAKALYFESLSLLRDVERRAFKVARCLFGLAQIAEAEGQSERFVTLLGAFEAHRSITPGWQHKIDIDPIKDKLQNYLEMPSYKTAYNKGLSMSKEQAIDYALSEYTTG
jgi:tetratricopeptide (TPR) repeat protein